MSFRCLFFMVRKVRSYSLAPVLSGVRAGRGFPRKLLYTQGRIGRPVGPRKGVCYDNYDEERDGGGLGFSLGFASY